MNAEKRQDLLSSLGVIPPRQSYRAPVVKIQAAVRGWLARRHMQTILMDYLEGMDREREAHITRQRSEGLMILDLVKQKQDIEDSETIRIGRLERRDTAARLIQETWRTYFFDHKLENMDLDI
jgi:hypothetical protein